MFVQRLRIAPIRSSLALPGLAVCALALLVGIATLDDHGVKGDVFLTQYALAEATLQYLAGDTDAFEALAVYHDRFYGAIFEVPLLLVERALGLDDSRSVFLARHLLTHLFFLATGFVGYLLACRLLRSRTLALFALALFLLHPRIYAHSFFNSTDVPFLGLFMICLWLAARAFGGGGRERGEWAAGTLGAFALCGVMAGLLVGLRVMGLVFVAVVVAACICDLCKHWTRGEKNGRRRTLARTAVFLASAVLAYYASMPYLWADPLGRFAELLTTLTQHPNRVFEVFQGDLVFSAALPAHYVPVWFGVTTPLLALLLGAIGVASLAWRGAARPSALLRNTPLRFELLLAACIALPLLAIVVLRPVMYDHWRHMYFLWAPFVLLAAFGLRALVDACRRLPLSSRRVDLTVYGLVALGLAAVVVQMARLHPHQHLYFNALATAPRDSVPLYKRYRMFNHRSMVKAGYTHIVDEHPNAVVNLPAHLGWGQQISFGAVPRHLELFPRHERRRVAFDPNADPDFYILPQRATAQSLMIDAPDAFFPPVLRERRIYGSALLRVATPDLSRVGKATAAAYRALYRKATAGTPVIDGYFDIYRIESAVVLAREDCAPIDLHESPRMTVYPAETAPPSKVGGFRVYTQALYGVRVGAACLWWTPLPAHPVAQIRIHGLGRLEPDAYLDEPRTRYAALATKAPAVRSTFDVYWSDEVLAYVKTPCAAADVEAPFFLHVVPAYTSDRHDFENLDFQWHRIDGEIFDDVCLAERKLPDYSIARIATGQFTPGGTALWRVEISPSAKLE